jgi:uncharacterized membrane protein YoaT (DUF817 family)
MSTGPRGFTSVEASIDAAAHVVIAKLPQTGVAGHLVEFLVFGIKQAWACLFGALLLALLVLTQVFWPETALITRYDFLFFCAVLAQVLLILFKLETLREAKVILIFHIVGTVMEIFKTSAGSWSYPGEAILRIGEVPLFSGFMYAAIGSYMARITRIFDIRLPNYPPTIFTLLLATGIYVNFFSHHFIVDFRYVLFGATVVIFWRCSMHFRVHRGWHKMPILLGFFLVTLFIWIAENIGTLTRTWIYPNQITGWSPVSLGKFGSWYLLMIISVVLVTFVHPPRPLETKSDNPN